MKAGDYVIYANPYDRINYIIQLEDEEYTDNARKCWDGCNGSFAFFEMPTDNLYPIKLPFLIRMGDENHTLDGKVMSIDYEKHTCEVRDGFTEIPLERGWFDTEQEYLQYLEHEKENKDDNITTMSLWDIHPLITSGK